MDLATIIGIVGAAVLVSLVMILDGGSPAELFGAPQAILLTFGGSLVASVASSPLSVAIKIPKYLMIAFLGSKAKMEPEKAIHSLVNMADKARREGLLALEEEAKKLPDPFLQKGVMLVVDGVDPAQVRAILEIEIKHMHERHEQGIGFFAAAGGFSPTFGIIGTVMGLITVLKELEDAAKFTKAIATAFLATLWGLLSANLIWIPIGNKLKANDDEEIAYRHLLVEGILALQAGENPRIVKEKLNAFLPPNERISDEQGSKQKAKASA
jgi:chemotaxis protein MotA